MRKLFLLLAVLVLPSSELAAAAKPKGCLTTAEIQAEQEIRHGVFLREAASRCDVEYTKGTRQSWDTFYTQAAPRFAKAKDKRIKAWQREFPDNWQRALTTADGRVVTYHRNYPLSGAYCQSVEDLVQAVTKKGYAGFSKQANTIQNEVIGDYKVCR
jgi:hypothetical protein